MGCGVAKKERKCPEWSPGNTSLSTHHRAKHICVCVTPGKGKERKGKERKGKERKGKERKGKERKGKERKRKEGRKCAASQHGTKHGLVVVMLTAAVPYGVSAFSMALLVT